MKNTYIGQAWLVLMLGLVFGACLAGVQVGLQDRIEANKRRETYGQIPNLVSGADADRTEELLIDGRKVYLVRDAAGSQVGWILTARGQGFADAVELLIGLDVAAEKITGLYVLDQKETPGLGSRITEDGWLKQFSEKPAAEALVVTKASPVEGGRILAVTGATVSSEKVCGIVNEALAQLRPKLPKAEKE